MKGKIEVSPFVEFCYLMSLGLIAGLYGWYNGPNFMTYYNSLYVSVFLHLAFVSFTNVLEGYRPKRWFSWLLGKLSLSGVVEPSGVRAYAMLCYTGATTLIQVLFLLIANYFSH